MMLQTECNDNPDSTPSTTHQLARNQFDAAAQHYANSVPHQHSDSLDIVRKWVAGNRYETALDIATGPGFTAFAIAPYCNKVIASDISEAMLDQVKVGATQRLLTNIETQFSDATTLPFSDDVFALVTCRTAPHHFNDIPAFINEAARTLVTGGTFILIDTSTVDDPEPRDWHHKVELARDPSHARALTPDEWTNALQRARFTVADSALTRVNMTFRDWVKRSNTPGDVVQALEQDFANATNKTRKLFNLAPIDNATDFSFSWPVFAALARKTA